MQILCFLVLKMLFLKFQIYIQYICSGFTDITYIGAFATYKGVTVSLFYVSFASLAYIVRAALMFERLI